MALDEHLIECVLGILSDERVSTALYHIANKRPDDKPLDNKKDMPDKECNDNILLKSPNEALKQNCLALQNELKQKSSAVSEYILKLDHMSQKLKEQENEIDKLTKENFSLHQENEQYHKLFSKQLGVYETYKKLPEELRHKNLNFISDASVFAFVSTGVQYLERFWDFIKEELLADRAEYAGQLENIFWFFFDMKNDIGQLYIRNECKIGDPYNYDRHIMMSGGKNLGFVSEILFLGFKDRNGKVIRKTVVRVKND